MNNIRKGFTLIELMIVVAIIAILAVRCLPIRTTWFVRRSRKACAGRWRQNRRSRVLFEQRLSADYQPLGGSGVERQHHRQLLRSWQRSLA